MNKQSTNTPRAVMAVGIMMATLACFPGAAQAQNKVPAETFPASRGFYPNHEGIVQPLNVDQLPSWMWFDFELRGRTEDQTALSYVPDKGRLYELTRAYGGVHITPTRWVTTYMQFHDTHALGLPLRDVASNMRDNFDLFQGYADFHAKPVEFIAGRQLLIFGDQRIIGISDWTNNSRSWDGFDLRLKAHDGKDTVDVFSTSVVAVNADHLDKHGAGLTFHGIEGNINTLFPNTSLQPFILLHNTPYVKDSQGQTGTKVAATPGFYYTTRLPKGFTSSGTVDIQRGHYATDSIGAHSDIVRGGYEARKLAWTPELEAEYDYATGNNPAKAYHYSLFDQQYPSNHNAFGLVDLFGFQNIKQRRLNLYMKPTPNTYLLFQTSSLHLQTTRDTVYGGAGTAAFALPKGGFNSDDIGTEFDASAKYIWRKSFVTNVGVGHFFPGAVMTEAKKGAPLTLAYLQFTYRFSLSKHGEAGN